MCWTKWILMVFALSSSQDLVSSNSLFQAWGLVVPICQIILFRLSNRANRVHAQVWGVELEPRASNLCHHFSSRYFPIKFPQLYWFWVVRMLLCQWKMVNMVGNLIRLDCWPVMVQSFVVFIFHHASFFSWHGGKWKWSDVYLVMILRFFREDGCTVTQLVATCLKLRRCQGLLEVWSRLMIWEASLWEMRPYHRPPKLGLWLLPLQMLILSSKERYVPVWCQLLLHSQ